MANISMFWEPWEISSLDKVKDYLIRNSERFYSHPLRHPINGRQLGESIRYDFRDFIDVSVSQRPDGSGKLIVMGSDIRPMNERFETLKSFLGFKKLNPI